MGHSVLQPFVDSGDLAGAVALVANSQDIVSLDAVGFADIAAKRPMQSDTLFWIASQTKPMTAAALMTLVEAGSVHLDDPVTRFLPEFKAQTPSVEHLLTHTSGMPFASAMETPTLDLLPLHERVQSYAMMPLLSEPGTAYRYSNAGINTAARIIEVVSGTDYATFLQNCLLGPLGMTDTTFWPDATQLSRLAKPYRPSQETGELEEISISQLSYPLDDPQRQPMPAGGLFSTASDVARFCQMFLNGGQWEGRRYLSEASVREMTRGRSVPNFEGRLGLGWFVEEETFSHGGALSTTMKIVPQSDHVLVYLVQHDGFPRRGSEAFGEFQKAALGD
jgi:CubicO group peptidase (beta-lactamase class C family)